MFCKFEIMYQNDACEKEALDLRTFNLATFVSFSYQETILSF